MLYIIFGLSFANHKCEMITEDNEKERARMDYKRVNDWLSERCLVLDESFPEALKVLALAYKKEHNIPLLNSVYQMIGTSKQEISKWQSRLTSVQTKKTTNETLFALRHNCLI